VLAAPELKGDSAAYHITKFRISAAAYPRAKLWIYNVYRMPGDVSLTILKFFHRAPDEKPMMKAVVAHVWPPEVLKLSSSAAATD